MSKIVYLGSDNSYSKIISNYLEAIGNKLFISTPNEQTFTNGDRGHVGILTRNYFNKFKERYNDNIKSVQYLNNTKLLNGDYITNNDNDSHFKIVLTK